MTNLYFLGIIVSSFVLIQIELIVILLIYLCFYFIGLQWLGEIVFCSLIAIMVISHLLTTVKASKYIKHVS